VVLAHGCGRACPSLGGLLAVAGLCWPCWVLRGCVAESAMSLPVRRVTAGLEGGAKRVAGIIAEVAARLLLVGAPGCGRACPSLEGMLAVAGLCWPCWFPSSSRLLGLCAGASVPVTVPVGLRGLRRGWALVLIRPPSRGWPSSPSVCRRCTLWGCPCQCLGSGGGGLQYCLEDPGVFAFGGGGGGGGGGP
jgi:hypothetical protein